MRVHLDRDGAKAKTLHLQTTSHAGMSATLSLIAWQALTRYSARVQPILVRTNAVSKSALA